MIWVSTSLVFHRTSQKKLAQFKKDHDLNFPLLSDVDKKVMEAYGAFGEKNNYGKKVQGVIRSTFLINNGAVALAQYNVKATGHVARVVRDLPELES